MAVSKGGSDLILPVDDVAVCVECKVVFSRERFPACPRCTQRLTVLPLGEYINIHHRRIIKELERLKKGAGT